MIWAQGFVELLCWRRQRQAQAASGVRLVAECEQFLAQVAGGEPSRWSDPPRPD